MPLILEFEGIKQSVRNQTCFQAVIADASEKPLGVEALVQRVIEVLQTKQKGLRVSYGRNMNS